LTDRHYLNGARSLRWRWQGGGELYFDRTIPFSTDQEAFEQLKTASSSVFSFWVYSERALPGAKLRIEFGDSHCGFDFGLDFTGWRTCAVSFTRDMEGTPQKGMRGLRIKAPENVPAGELFLDRIILASVDQLRYQWPDFQVPFVNRGSLSFRLTPLPKVSPSSVSPQQHAAVELLEERYEQNLLLPGPAAPDAVPSMEERFADYRIRLEEGVITGAHILMMRPELRDRQDSVYPRELTEQDRRLMDQYREFRGYTDLMREMAKACRSLPPEDAAAERLREMFLLMNRHALDQGWQYGSALGTTHHFGYASRGWYEAVFLMRDELKQAGQLDATVRALYWFMREKADFARMEHHPAGEVDLDYLNTVLQAHMLTVLSLADGPVKTALVGKLSGYLSDLLAADTPGTLGGIKADGTGFHHGGNYPGYSFPAYRSVGEVCRLLHGTPFAVRSDGLRNFNKALTAAVLYSNPETGLGLCGRHPFDEQSLATIEGALRAAAECGYPVKLDPGNMPDGHWSFNYGCFGIHRWNGKMVTLKGFNRYVWSSEIYTRDNRYGRYQSNGGVQIYNAGGRAASGFEQDGWDWNRNPGATILYRPLSRLESPRTTTLMDRSRVRFSGSSHLLNRYGIFAVDLREPDLPTFDPLFTARKSMFCFDNRIICLGAGISAGAGDDPVETVLFQHAWKDGASTVWMGSDTPVEQIPWTQESEGMPAWLVDGHGNGYCVMDGGSVKLKVATQQSKHNKTREPTAGDFASAWIGHGRAPRDAAYEYIVVLDGTPEKMAAIATDKPYRVISNDRRAQVVYDTESGVAGYALYDEYTGPENSPVVSALQPCLIMLRMKGAAMDLSVGNADLRIPAMGSSYVNDEESRPGVVEFTIRGRWTARGEEGIETRIEGGNTRIIARVMHAAPVQIKLVRGGG
jgi:chondroitin-sulfate-ABC endolyase/exolyase